MIAPKTDTFSRAPSPPPIFAFSEASPQMASCASARALVGMTEAAALADFRVYSIPSHWQAGGDAESALWHVTPTCSPALGVWIGYIPEPERYQAMYAATARRRIHLVNTPAHYARAEHFDQYYLAIADLTMPSRTVRTPRELAPAARDLGFPLFVRGAVQSMKHLGPAGCIAHNGAELEAIAARLWRSTSRSQGRVVLRRYEPLRHAVQTAAGMPQGREFRVFLYRDAVLGHGYYWPDAADPLATLTPEETTTVLALARRAARRIGVPYVAIDVGQREDGMWRVIEAGDGQFSGICQVPRIALWHRLATCLTTTEPAILSG